MRGRTVLAACVSLAAMSVATTGGDLNPPPGVPAPTHKTLTQVEPRTPVQTLPGTLNSLHVISQPGSYYLTGNIQGVAGLHGIEIDADNVTLDLNGFQVLGAAGPANKHGVFVSSQVNVAIRNGLVQNWTGSGIGLAGNGGALIEGIRATGNAGSGISAFVINVIIQDCITTGNGHGILLGGRARVSRCIANSNTLDGVNFDADCIIENCTASFNGNIGLFHTSGEGSVLTGNSCYQNAIHGISMCAESVLTGNVCNRNGTAIGNGAGILARCGGVRIDSNLVSNNDIGIQCFDNGRNVVIRNNARGNATNYISGVGNDFGPIGTAALATSPWANISN